MTCSRLSILSGGAPLAAAALASGTAAAQSPAAAIANPGFEEGAPGETPSGWGLGTGAPGAGTKQAYRAVIDLANPRGGSASARLERALVGDAAFGSLSQVLDARPYRSRRIRMTAAVRVGPQAGHTGVWLRVDRAGGRLGFFDNMARRPITGVEWADYVIEGEVASDAERIALGLLLQGDGPAWIDEVRIEDLGPAPNVDLFAYLDEALIPLKTAHINTASADWSAIEARARKAVAGAAQLSDVHEAIREVIAELREPHTFLRSMPPAVAGPQPEPRMPIHTLLDGRVGVMRLPGFIGSPEQAARYTAALREALTDMASTAPVCGWIVDLRDNTGGNMWPMLNGLDPLLGKGPFGAFRTPAGQLVHWVRTSNGIAPSPEVADAGPAFTVPGADAPLAVLLGPRTASSGEMTAMAFVGRESSRSFGAATAGFTTANVTVPMSDGAILAITTSYARDRTDHEYVGPMMPDEPVDAEETEAAAMRWLQRQASC